jgi:carbamoyl-phosphate synthase large subunit
MSKILVIGSGGLRVGQAGEFDYSGSQAIKAFKDDGHQVVLVNPNIATVQTDKNMADKTYFVSLQIKELEQILIEEEIELLALGFGGQTALNLGLELHKSGILQQYKIEVLGSSIASILATEDRELFRDTLLKHQIKTPISKLATTCEQAVSMAQEIGYPLMMRSGFSLGGLGSGKISSEEELITKVTQTLSVTPQVLLEEYLTGWKEFEYEIVRDTAGNALTICNMENLDPMGIHTGESIVVAPAQTLNDREHQQLRDVALQAAEIFAIIGECNIQFAVNPTNGDYRVIEMNPRLSRSSALASKATGYPLAYVAAKLCLGYQLYQIRNHMTDATSAFFEPALDYIVVKIPRWDTHKLREAERKIGSEMKSVGEVMAIGRSFPEALQKAVQMLNIGASCLLDYPQQTPNLADELEFATDRRIFALYQWFAQGNSVTQAAQLSHIDPWFLNQIQQIADFSNDFAKQKLNATNLLAAKQLGISDKAIAELHDLDELAIRALRLKYGVQPVVKQIDTVAGEFQAQSNYLYLTYHGTHHDLTSSSEHICILGSGPYAIGSSVEFDWCTVNLARELRKQKQNVIIINSNPETVSTDYDESERLYFEPLSLERVADILEFENPQATVVSVGGQAANNLVLPFSKLGHRLLGTSATDINQAEDRQLFSQLLHDAEIDQPRWINATTSQQIIDFVTEVGFPVIVRPSYVLSGAAMKVATNHQDLTEYLATALKVSPANSVVVCQFISDAAEIEVDGVAANGAIIFSAIAEHIENAGVHSGDATLVYPTQNLAPEIITQINAISSKIVANLNIHGPFNMQLLLKDKQLKVIECNVRASRSFPFISKVSGYNLIELVTQVFLNPQAVAPIATPQLKHLGVKTPVFSYNRFKGCDPVAQVEMSSTGEVACIGTDLLTTFYRSWQAAGQTINGKRLLIGAPQSVLQKLAPSLTKLHKQGWLISADNSTCNELNAKAKNFTHSVADIPSAIKQQQFDLVINIPENVYDSHQNQEQFTIRRQAIDYHIPLITNLQLANLILQCLILEQ